MTCRDCPCATTCIMRHDFQGLVIKHNTWLGSDHFVVSERMDVFLRTLCGVRNDAEESEATEAEGKTG